eukprot:scaffold8488_cov101-Isochrysis_galbana.AAC.2
MSSADRPPRPTCPEEHHSVRQWGRIGSRSTRRGRRVQGGHSAKNRGADQGIDTAHGSSTLNMNTQFRHPESVIIFVRPQYMS